MSRHALAAAVEHGERWRGLHGVPHTNCMQRLTIIQLTLSHAASNSNTSEVTRDASGLSARLQLFDHS